MHVWRDLEGRRDASVTPASNGRLVVYVGYLIYYRYMEIAYDLLWGPVD